MLAFDVTTYGAVGDGATDDQPSIQKAIAAASSAGGGVVYFPPTGHAYLIKLGLVVPQGVLLKGAGTRSAPPADSPTDRMALSDWDHHGTWIYCTDTVNSGILITGDGAGVDGINIFYLQPQPDGSSWTPTTWPWAIAANGQLSFLSFRNIMIVGATNGLILNFGTNTVGGGTGTIIDNVYMIVHVCGLQIIAANDTVYVNDLSVVDIFFPPQIKVFTLNSLIGIRFTHTENPVVTNVQVLAARWGIFVENATTTLGSETGIINGFFSNIQLNLCTSALAVAATDTQLVAQFENVLAQNTPLSWLTNPYSAPSPDTLFNLQSHEIDVSLSNVVLVAGNNAGIILGDGNTSSTTLWPGPTAVVSNLKGRFNMGGGTSPLFQITAHAILSLGSSMVLDSGAGSVKAGAGILRQVTVVDS
jgi:hypothetical protein